MLKCLTNSSLHWRQTPITNLIREDVFMKVSMKETPETYKIQCMSIHRCGAIKQTKKD
jgi:hypothetical protein